MHVVETKKQYHDVRRLTIILPVLIQRVLFKIYVVQMHLSMIQWNNVLRPTIVLPVVILRILVSHNSVCMCSWTIHDRMFLACFILYVLTAAPPCLKIDGKSACWDYKTSSDVLAVTLLLCKLWKDCHVKIAVLLWHSCCASCERIAM